jgi:hypothetical protein
MQSSLAAQGAGHETGRARSPQIYPTTIRRKVLRHLYLQPLRGCYLFKGCKQRFLDAFLTAARVEMFMPGVQVRPAGLPTEDRVAAKRSRGTRALLGTTSLCPCRHSS